jgi:hypothetical protein
MKKFATSYCFPTLRPPSLRAFLKLKYEKMLLTEPDVGKVVVNVDSDPQHVVVEGQQLSQDEAGEFPVHRLHQLTDGKPGVSEHDEVPSDGPAAAKMCVQPLWFNISL